MYKQIVVGYDGSDRARRAVDEAATMAGAMGSALHLVTAVEKDEIHEFGTGSDHQFISDVQIAKKNLKFLASDYSNLDVTTLATVGKPAATLLSEAQRVNADVIVVGNKNVQGITRVFGSVADDVAQKAQCAVLIAQTSDQFAAAAV